MNAPLRLVVFDVDGTLIDSQAHILAAVQAAFTDVGLPVPEREAVLEIIGLSLPVAVRRLVPEATDMQLAALTGHYRAAFAERRTAGESPLFAGARGALDALAGRGEVLMGIATGKSRRGLDHAIGSHRLGGYFVTKQVADDHPSKPHPSMLHAALRETGAEAGSGVMIGDTTYDMEMARNAGLRGIGVAWGYHAPERLCSAGAERVIETFDDLAAVLDELWETA
jgi:phosphoglycolate phosphatase